MGLRTPESSDRRGGVLLPRVRVLRAFVVLATHGFAGAAGQRGPPVLVVNRSKVL